MDSKITTFKELIRLFYDFKHCKVVPILNESNFVKGYYLKKKVIANASSGEFLTKKIDPTDYSVLEKANSENEGEFLEQLGELDRFPVLFSDGSYKIVNFTDFLTDHVPLKYDTPPMKDIDSYDIPEQKVQTNLHSEEITADKTIPSIEESEITSKKETINNENQVFEQKHSEPKTKREDLFDSNSDKIKPFFEEFDFNGTFDLVAYLEGIEKRVIEKYLNYYDFNITHTSDALKIPRQTLQYKIKKYGLEN